MRLPAIVIVIAAVGILPATRAQESSSAAKLVDSARLLSLLPEPPAGWKADKPFGGQSQESMASQVSLATRDYSRGEGSGAAKTTIMIRESQRSLASDDFFDQRVEELKRKSESYAGGHAELINFDGNVGFESFVEDGNQGTLQLRIADRFVLLIQTEGQKSAALQEWVKRIDLKKLAELK